MARVRRKLLVGVVLLGVSGLSSAIAETIPLPTRAPLPKEGAPPPSAARPAASPQPASPVSGLATGLRSLFNLDKQPESAPPAATAGA
ncbi:MAG TPA: hypothetical protein VGH39_02850, partial [Xanthobacteraceae bacterium]